MRKGAKSGVGHLERMKRGSGIKDREDKSTSIEILIDFKIVYYESIKRMI